MEFKNHHIFIDPPKSCFLCFWILISTVDFSIEVSSCIDTSAMKTVRFLKLLRILKPNLLYLLSTLALKSNCLIPPIRVACPIQGINCSFKETCLECWSYHTTLVLVFSRCTSYSIGYRWGLHHPFPNKSLQAVQSAIKTFWDYFMYMGVLPALCLSTMFT